MEMSTVSHHPAGSMEYGSGTSMLLLRDMWASLAISAMWIAVAVSAVWGPNLVSSNGAGTQAVTVPSAIVVALFAFLGSWALLKAARVLYLGQSSMASTYGAAGSVMILLLWVYYSCQILLFGAELTRVYARRDGSNPVPEPFAAKDPGAVS